MEEIDFFVHINGFFSQNVYRPAEIGFAQIFGSREIDLWTISLDKLKFTRRDKELNFAEYRQRHGILPPYAAGRGKFFSKVDYADLQYFFRFVFLDRSDEPVKTFAVRGAEQLAAFRLISEDAEVVDMQGELSRDDPPVVATAPRFHPGYHSDAFRGAGCAAEIASSWACLVRDVILCGEGGGDAAPEEKGEEEDGEDKDGEDKDELDYDRW